jgi:hypothetical protein
MVPVAISCELSVGGGLVGAVAVTGTTELGG